MKAKLRELRDRFGGEVTGDLEVSIEACASLTTAGTGDIAFAEAARYRPQVEAGGASAYLVTEDFPDVPGKTLWAVARPRETFIGLLAYFYPDPQYASGVHASASVASSAQLDHGVSVSEYVVIGEDVRIGRGTSIESGAHVGCGVTLGEDCRIGPNVSLLRGVRLGNQVTVNAGAVIGGDGFGYLWMDNRHTKVPSLGSVQIDDDVEIGCNACIDRATFGMTRIRRGARIDNLVQIGHNNDIGEDAIIVSQVGLSGTVKVGNRAVLAGQVGVADHIEVGERATVAAASGVSKDVPPGEIVWGYPARSIRKAWRELAHLARLPRLLRQIKILEMRVKTLEEQTDKPEKS
ncbi:MAG: UDP-3-O-(3-hydroxymyristoyl)glucosamine N-acyltransferase [Gammaproteobacteria bacterium]|nr:UDP-3-O-(3-hydroxymyristoyl)glucosamine N-acyltransferase [Gammaproteobacteria bacterium]